MQDVAPMFQERGHLLCIKYLVYVVGVLLSYKGSLQESCVVSSILVSCILQVGKLYLAGSPGGFYRSTEAPKQ